MKCKCGRSEWAHEYIEIDCKQFESSEAQKVKLRSIPLIKELEKHLKKKILENEALKKICYDDKQKRKESIKNVQKRLDEKFVWENKEMVGDIWVRNAVHEIFEKEFGKGMLE